MEAVGFAIGIAGLAGLFSVCLDIVDKVDSYRDFGVDSRSIIAQFDADKLLFRRWAENVGIDKNKMSDKHHCYLDNSETVLIVQKILSSIREIFSKTDTITSNLGRVMKGDPTASQCGCFHENSNLSKADVPISERGRISWSLRGKAKFTTQVQQFGALVQRLHSLVPPDAAADKDNVCKRNMDNSFISLNETATWFSKSQQILIEMEKQIEYEIRKELDMWLSSSSTNDLYDNFVRRRLNGTCDWILDLPAFLNWISSDFPSGTAKMLWIIAPAGYGKTILCARMVQHLFTNLDSPPAYFFFSSDSGSRGDPFVVLRSWISQVISHDHDALELAYQRWQAQDGRIATRTDIIEVLRAIVHNRPGCTFIVDSLDECTWAEEKWKIHDCDSAIGFFESIKEATANSLTRVMIVSRNEPAIREGFYGIGTNDANRNLTEYRISLKDVRNDAISFSRSIVDKKLANKSKTQKDELSQRIVNRCDGMFLWMKMLEEHLRGGMNKAKLEDTVDKAPTAIEHLYDRNWKRISDLADNERRRAFSILRWTAFALRPLTIVEITEALLVVDDDDCKSLMVNELPDALDDDYVESEILGLCGSLLEIQNTAPDQDIGSMTVHLSHFSVKQYLLCNMLAQEGQLMANEQLRLSNEAIQSNTLAKLCLRYLNFRSVWEQPLHFHDSPVTPSFLDYAAGLWHQHIYSSGLNYSEVVTLVNILFDPTNSNWESWRKWFDSAGQGPEGPKVIEEINSTSPLLYASLLGLNDTVTYLIEAANVEVNHIDGLKRTALQMACQKGRTVVVKSLLEKGADVAIADNAGRTPLLSASSNGHIDVVRLLLDNSADISLADSKGWTPLSRASCNGHIEVVRQLLEKDAGMAVANISGWTPLSQASFDGYIEVVRLLLEKGADVTVKTNDGWTPLALASYNGHVEVVRLLLEKGAKATVKCNDGYTPLDSASKNGHLEVTKLLLENGADSTVAGSGGLIWASETGHIEVVKVLLDNSANIRLKDMWGRTALSRAAGNGHDAIVKLLLAKNGANQTEGDNIGRTPLTYAAKNGHSTVVMSLLTHDDVEPDPKDHYGSTPLSMAARNCYIEVVKILLATGCVDFNNSDCFGRTSLWWARKGGHTDMEQLLLDYAVKRGIAVRENDEPIEVSWVPRNMTSIWCDVCALGIPEEDSRYKCQACNGGDFDICVECYEVGGRCLKDGHELIQRKYKRETVARVC